MFISSAVTFYLAITCFFGVLAYVFFQNFKKNKNSLQISFQATLACAIGFNYVGLITTTNHKSKIIFYTIHFILLVATEYNIYDFILVFSSAKNIAKQRIFAFMFAIATIIIYCFYPATNYFSILHKIDWHKILLKSIHIPPFLVFSLFTISLTILNIKNIYHRYKSPESNKRERYACFYLGVFFGIALLVNSTFYFIKYYFYDFSHYTDLSLLTILFFLLTIIFCQQKFHILEINTDDLIYNLINNFPEGLAVVDYKLRLTWHNKSFAKYFLEGKNFTQHSPINEILLSDFNENIFKNKHKIQTKIDVHNQERKILFSSLPTYSNKKDFISAGYYIQDITALENKKAKLAKAKKKTEKIIFKKNISLKKLNAKLRKSIHEKTSEEEKIFYTLNFDTATGLYNRKTIIQKLDSLIRRNEELYVVYIDIDDIKMLNDSLGHNLVDELIVKVAKRLKRLNRKLEYQKAIARFSSDEFLIILGKSSNLHSACLDIQKIISEPFIIDDTKVNITASIGVSIFPNDGIDSTTLIRFADMAMYTAKHKGKNRIEYFDSKLKNQIETEFFISEQIKHELINGLMPIFIEPIVKIEYSGERIITAFEITHQWSYGINKILNENAFLSIVRRAGLLKKIDRWIITTGIKKISQSVFFKKNKNLRLMLFVSELSFYSPTFLDYILETLNAYKLKPSKLEIEITETTLMQNPSSATIIISQFQNLDVNITIKNFGVSYSSLNYLNKFNCNKIKISEIFTREIGKSLKDESIIKLLILLTDKINMETIAEGVKNLNQLQFLIQNNCRAFQGSSFSNIMIIDDFLKLIESDDIYI